MRAKNSLPGKVAFVARKGILKDLIRICGFALAPACNERVEILPFYTLKAGTCRLGSAETNHITICHRLYTASQNKTLHFLHPVSGDIIMNIIVSINCIGINDIFNPDVYVTPKLLSQGNP